MHAARREFSARSIRVVAALGAATSGIFGAPLLHAQQQDFSNVEIRAEKVAGSLWMLTGSGGNIGLSVGDDTVFVIDDQFAPLVPKIKEAIARITPKPVQWLLNTHHHFDHTGGNEGFGSTGAVIVAHDNVRKRMAVDQLLSFAGSTQTIKATPQAGLPVVTVPGDIRFHVNGDEVHAFHVPRAHTDGDLIVHFTKANAFHMGDTFFNGFYPFIDASGGGSADGVVAALDRVLALANDATRIIPGHGPLASKSDLARYRAMLSTITQRIKDQRRAGKSDAEIVAGKPSADFDTAWGNGLKPDAFVQMMLGAIPR